MAKLLDLLVEDLVSRAVAESAKDPTTPLCTSSSCEFIGCCCFIAFLPPLYYVYSRQLVLNLFAVVLCWGNQLSAWQFRVSEGPCGCRWLFSMSNMWGLFWRFSHCTGHTLLPHRHPLSRSLPHTFTIIKTRCVFFICLARLFLSAKACRVCQCPLVRSFENLINSSPVSPFFSFCLFVDCVSPPRFANTSRFPCFWVSCFFLSTT